MSPPIQSYGVVLLCKLLWILWKIYRGKCFNTKLRFDACLPRSKYIGNDQFNPSKDRATCQMSRILWKRRSVTSPEIGPGTRQDKTINRRHVENSAFKRVFYAEKIDPCSVKMALETKLSIFESDRETGMKDRYNENCILYKLQAV